MASFSSPHPSPLQRACRLGAVLICVSPRLLSKHAAGSWGSRPPTISGRRGKGSTAQIYPSTFQKAGRDRPGTSQALPDHKITLRRCNCRTRWGAHVLRGHDVFGNCVSERSDCCAAPETPILDRAEGARAVAMLANSAPGVGVRPLQNQMRSATTA